VSTHVEDPTTGVGTLGGRDLTLTGRDRQRGLLVLSSGGTGHQCVVGYPGRVCGLRWGLVEVYVSGKNEGGRKGTYLLFGLQSLHKHMGRNA
jgi:hypothetical protein